MTEQIPTGEATTVPIGELEELVEQWEHTAAMKHPAENDVFNARCDAWRKAAEELQTLIDKHDPKQDNGN